MSASLCVGLTLPGMIDDPGSFSGRDSSPRPQLQRKRSRTYLSKCVNAADNNTTIIPASRKGSLVTRTRALFDSPRTRAEEADIVGNLHEGACNGVKSSGCLDDRIVRCECLELVLSRDEGQPRLRGDLRCNVTVEAL